jgi:hypothetical protein
MIETIPPLQKETNGVRNEIRFLTITMTQGFALMDERFQRIDQSKRQTTCIGAEITLVGFNLSVGALC